MYASTQASVVAQHADPSGGGVHVHDDVYGDVHDDLYGGEVHGEVRNPASQVRIDISHQFYFGFNSGYSVVSTAFNLLYKGYNAYKSKMFINIHMCNIVMVDYVISFY